MFIFGIIGSSNAIGQIKNTEIIVNEGSIVQNNENYWCENIKLGYEVKGDAYDANHNRYGLKSAEYTSGSVYSPNVGSTYSIDGPSDYYYCMGVAGSAIVGYNYGTICK